MHVTKFHDLHLDSDSSDDEDETEIPDISDLVADIIKFVKGGNADKHMMKIFREEIKSKWHKTFFGEDSGLIDEFGHKPWFGPINNFGEQIDLYEYCFNFFYMECKLESRAHILCYVYQVWVPEVIMKAVSVLKGVSANEAEKMFKESNFRAPIRVLS